MEKLNKSDYDKIERSKKPFAEFKIPNLTHLNTPKVKEYLKRPRRIKFDKKPIEIASNMAPVGVFKVRVFDKVKPFKETDFKEIGAKAKNNLKGESKNSFTLVSHLGSKRTVPIENFAH